MSSSIASLFVMIFGINLMLWLFVECWVFLVAFLSLDHTLGWSQPIMLWMMYFVLGLRQVFLTVRIPPPTIVRRMRELGSFVPWVGSVIFTALLLHFISDLEQPTGEGEVNISNNGRFQWIFNLTNKTGHNYPAKHGDEIKNTVTV